MTGEKKLNDLNIELRKLATEAGLPDWHLGLEIVIEGQEQGRLSTRPPDLPPELWDPESDLRRVYAQIVALRKEMQRKP
jgi:hypothetical protein